MFTLYLELRTAGLNYPCKVADEIGLWHCFMKHGTSLDVISFPGYKNGICWSLITLATYLESEGLLFWTNLTVISGPRHCWNIWGWLKMSNYSLKYPTKFRKTKKTEHPSQPNMFWLNNIHNPTFGIFNPLNIFPTSRVPNSSPLPESSEPPGSLGNFARME
jgi:hypothetical protein